MNGAIRVGNLTALLEWLEQRKHLFFKPVDYEIVVNIIQSGKFELSSTDEDVKEIEEALNKITKSGFDANNFVANGPKWVRQLLTKISELESTIGELDTAHRMMHARNERLEKELAAAKAEVEELRQFYKDAMQEQAKEYLQVGQKLDRASEALKETRRLLDWPNSTGHIKLLIDEALQSIKGESS